MSHSQAILLGLDIGTTATKAALFDLSGQEVARAEQAYPLQTPQAGWVEQDPEALWQALVTVVRAVLAEVESGQPLALALAAQSGSLIPAKADGTPMYPVITWLDGRTEALVKQWHAEGVQDQVREISGWLLHPGLCLPTIAWLRRFKPELFNTTGRFLSVNDFLVHRLTGQFCTNPSNGGGMQLANIRTGRWSERLCGLAGIRPEHLSPIQPSGTVIGSIRPEVSRLTGLPAETVVVNGGHDQGCTALGMGVTAAGRVLLACGTSWVITAVTEKPAVETIPAQMDMNFHPAPDRWTVSQSLGGLGASLEWWLGQGWQGIDAQKPAGRAEIYAALDRELAETSPEKEKLFFLPLTGGHEEPAGIQRGGFIGLRLGHARTDMARSILEGGAFELRWALEKIKQSGLAVERLWMVGGAARSPVWPQIVADVTGLPLAVSEYDQWPALGAAILAGLGAGVFESLPGGQTRFQKATRDLNPIQTQQQNYTRSFATYQQLAKMVRKHL